MKKARIVPAIFALILSLALVLSGCSSAGEEPQGVYVVSIRQTDTSEEENEFTVTYSDGTTSTFTVKNGQDGQDGKDAAVSAADLYEEYKNIYGEDLTYDEFLQKYLQASSDNSSAVAGALRSSVRVYSEFRTTEYSSGWGPVQANDVTSYSTGGGVVCEVGEEYTYIITNYHVVYSTDANEDNGSDFGRRFYVYPYGSVDVPAGTGQKDEDGYEILEYGESAIECTYVGGAASLDIAVLRAETADVLAVNEDICAVTYADGYSVGETAIAIGNPEGEGISVTEGIVSVDSEYISLQTDGTVRRHRSMRIDSALYHGNSGGGLFNTSGELIGITNAGDEEDQNIIYAIPVSVARGAAENIIAYDKDGDDSTAGVYRPTLGVTVNIESSKYVYDEESGTGSILETVVVSEIAESSIGSQMGLAAGDVLVSFVVNGTAYPVSRSFEVNDLLLTVRAGDAVSFTVERGGETVECTAYTLTASDFSAVE